MKIPITVSTKPKQTLVSGGSGTHPSKYATKEKEGKKTDFTDTTLAHASEHDLSTSLPHQD